MEETISDPTGFEVVLTDECWQHITARHPEAGPFREFVREAIRQPDGIYLGKRDPTRRIYRKRYMNVPGLGGPLDILVFVGNADRYVATAVLFPDGGGSDMAFRIVQRFGKLDYRYDRQGDVLDVSFGSPVPAIAVQVEDWAAIRIALNPPSLQGITIVGYKKIFARLNRYLEKELPRRMKRLARVEVSIAYDDESDTLIMHLEEKPSVLHKLIRKPSFRGAGQPSIFEPLVKWSEPPGEKTSGEALENVYVEKSLPSMDIVGIKILQYTQCGPAAFEGILGAIIDTLFEPDVERDENIRLITSALFHRLDWHKLATLAA